MTSLNRELNVAFWNYETDLTEDNERAAAEVQKHTLSHHTSHTNKTHGHTHNTHT